MIEVALSQSSSLYSREPRMWCRAKGWCGFGKGWWCSNPSGSRPNFCGRQHLTFDKGRAWMPEVERPKFCRTQNKQSVHKARALCGARDSAVLKRFDGVAIPPVVARIFVGDSTSPLTRDGHGCPKLNARSFAGRKTNRAFIRQG